jgi:hypothetical protein
MVREVLCQKYPKTFGQVLMHHVEQFVTYACNYIGKTYLRRHVDVYVYGHRNDIQPNLYQNLTHLCKEIHAYPTLSGELSG